MKLKASPAHSHKFMEIMLLKALKKAGYDEEKQIKEKVKLSGYRFGRQSDCTRNVGRSRRR